MFYYKRCYYYRYLMVMMDSSVCLMKVEQEESHVQPLDGKGAGALKGAGNSNTLTYTSVVTR